MMLAVCAWCKEELGWRPGPEGQVTHGICKPCQARLQRVRRRPTRRQKLAVAIGFVLWLLLSGVVGECDRRDAEAYITVRSEIMAAAPAWAVTR